MPGSANPEQPPSEPLSAPGTASGGASGTQRGSGAAPGPQTGTQSLDYDRDPEAIAWARTKIQPSIDKAERFSREADTEEARTKWRWIAKFMHRELIGSGEGCTITAFDERLPAHRARMDRAVPLATYLANREQP